MTDTEFEKHPAYQEAELEALDMIRLAAVRPDWAADIASGRVDVLDGRAVESQYLIAALAVWAGRLAAAQFTTPGDDGLYTEMDADSMQTFLDRKFMHVLHRQARDGAVDRWIEEEMTD